MMNKLPNFVIAGVARCGTTSLYHYLKQHPEIGFPKIKEPKYFSSLGIKFPHNGIGDETVDAKIIKDYNTYQNLFSDLKDFKSIGEASSDYFYYHKITIPQIKKTLGDVPIIIMIRNPIERAHSAYNNLSRDNREKLSFEDALMAEQERINNNWDWMWAYKAGSLYADGIEAFQQNFSNVLVLLNDDLENDPQTVLKQVYQFLGVSDHFLADTKDKYSHSGKPKSKIIGKLIGQDSLLGKTIRKVVMKLIPRRILERVASKIFKKEDLSHKISSQLYHFFEEDIQRTEQITGKNLSKWKK